MSDNSSTPVPELEIEQEGNNPKDPVEPDHNTDLIAEEAIAEDALIPEDVPTADDSDSLSLIHI